MKQVELASHTALGKTPCAITVVIVYRRVDWLRWYSTHLLVWGSLSDGCAGRMSQGAGLYRGLTVSKNKLMFLDEHFIRCTYVENTHTEYCSLTEKSTSVRRPKARTFHNPKKQNSPNVTPLTQTAVSTQTICVSATESMHYYYHLESRIHVR